MLKFGLLQNWQRSEQLMDPPITIERFPLQRGYARPPISRLFPFEHRLLNHLLARTTDPEEAGLICSTPYYAPLAELWPGPVVYYATDLTMAYFGADSTQVIALDRRMCQVATAVCPNSRRIADYFITRTGCDPRKISIVPNATRAGNISAKPLLQPGPLPHDLADLKRPIVGIIGNLAGNMDWLLLEQAISLTPHIAWVFVGPTTMAIQDPVHEAGRARVQKMATFVGMKSYDQLQAYARSFDVAILPYRKHEPTYSGSSTRFYEHLAACRPMLATRGFAELLEKPPLLTLVDTAEDIRNELAHLEDLNFKDGLEYARWQASRTGTWDDRATAVVDAVAARRPSDKLISV